MENQNDILASSNSEIIISLGQRYKEYRLACRLTQREAADRSGMSVVTLRQFENGKAYNITMGNLLGLLRTVNCLHQVNELLPEIPLSPYALQKIYNKQPKRIRHEK